MIVNRGGYEGLDFGGKRDKFEWEHWRTFNATAGSHNGHGRERRGLVGDGSVSGRSWKRRLLRG